MRGPNPPTEDRNDLDQAAERPARLLLADGPFNLGGTGNLQCLHGAAESFATLARPYVRGLATFLRSGDLSGLDARPPGFHRRSGLPPGDQQRDSAGDDGRHDS